VGGRDQGRQGREQREKQRETERDGETNIDSDKQTDSERQREAGGEREREKARERALKKKGEGGGGVSHLLQCVEVLCDEQQLRDGLGRQLARVGTDAVLETGNNGRALVGDTLPLQRLGVALGFGRLDLDKLVRLGLGLRRRLVLLGSLLLKKKSG